MQDRRPIAVIITDTHLDEDNFEQNLSVVNQTVSICQKYSLKDVYHAGDLFTTRISQKLDTLKNFKVLTDIFKANGITLHYIAGNHDKTSHISSSSYVDIYQNDYVVNCDMKVKRFQGLRVHFLSFYEDYTYREKLDSLKKQIDTDCINVLITHIGIEGVLTNDDSECTSSIKRTDFKGFDYVYIGHYHNRNSVNESIRYIGSTDARDFGEDSNKGCSILYSDGTEEKVLFKFKEFKTITVNSLKDLDFACKENSESTKDFNIKIKVILEQKELVKLDKKEIESLGFTVEAKVKDIKVVEEVETEEISISKHDKKSIIKNWSEYCLKNKVNPKHKTEFIKKV